MPLPETSIEIEELPDAKKTRVRNAILAIAQSALNAETAQREADILQLETAIDNLNTTTGVPFEYIGTNPMVGTDHNFVQAVGWRITTDAVLTEIGFPTFASHGITTIVQDGYNDIDQVSKSTFHCNKQDMIAYGQGQRILSDTRLTAFGSGDAITYNNLLELYGGLTSSGDEGQKLYRDYVSQGQQIQRGTISSVSRSGINTTATQNITASRTPQTVTVADASGCSIGDWIQFDVGLPDGGDVSSQTPYSRAEAVQVTAISGNTITALFRHSHPTGCLVKPCTVLYMGGGTSFGQGRYLVNLSATPYTTGTARGNGVNSRGLSLTGNGTSWSTGMVGGDAYNIGLLSFDIDEVPNYHGVLPLRVFYPLWDLASSTSVKMHRRTYVGLAVYQGKASTPGDATFFNYKIHPGARILKVTNNTAIVVLEYNNFTWTVGNTVECAHSHSFDVSGQTFRIGMNSVGGEYRRGIELSNVGKQDFETGIEIGYAAGDYGGRWITGLKVTGEKDAINVSVNNTANAIQINHSDTQKAAIDWTNRMRIQWNVLDDAANYQHGMRIKTSGQGSDQFMDFYGTTGYGVGVGKMEYNGDIIIKPSVNQNTKFAINTTNSDTITFEPYVNGSTGRSGLKIYNVFGATKTLIGTFG